MSILSNFLVNLCKQENLIDVSSFGDAKQSSLSKWSREDDAKQVLLNDNKDFAQHTDYELAPWLEIDLKRLYYPNCIVIQNRAKRPFDEIAATLIIEASTDGDDFFLLHSGLVYFGNLPDSIPLILPYGERIALRFLRLSLQSTKKVPLHLRRVNILVSKPPDITQSQRDVHFYSARLDGLGERLKSLINAMVLSEHYKSDFKFTWDAPEKVGLAPSHAVQTVDNTFSSEFIEQHYVERVPTEIHELEKKINFFDDDLPKKKAIQVSHNSIYKQIPPLKNFLEPALFRSAFYKIEFTSTVKEAINWANQVPIDINTVSIHLRSGDIVYGRYRYDDRYTNKVISYALADYLISSLKTEGRRALLFGQSNSVCRHLANKTSSLYFGDNERYQSMNQLQQAIFDVVLMSRTTRIFAGNSGFSQLASLIGGVEILMPDKYCCSSESANYISSLLLSDEVNQYDDLQNAFSHWHYVYFYKNFISVKQSIAFLEKAVSFDPDNLFYHVVLATLYFDDHDIGKCEKIIKSVFDRNSSITDKYGSYSFLRRLKHPDGKKTLHRYKNKLYKMKSAGVAGAVKLVDDFG